MSSQFIEKYEVLETLGKGSMGVVYKARDPEIGRMVAIKTLKAIFLSEDAVGQEALQRFRQESRSAGRLHHPNIVTIFEAGRAQNGSPYIVMEYIEGASLEGLIRERAVIEPLEAFHYLSQIASAIDYALSQNIIHRDIKPSNIIVDLRHRPFLLDFGVAKLSDTSLTPAGTVVGTPSYMSPEQIRGETLDGRSDLFSFAVVTYETLTGKRPFPGNDFTTVVSNILQKPPLPFSDVGCSLPKYLESVLAQGLARDREQRFSTASAFIDAAAQTLGISLDNTGLIGGFRPGMKLPEIASGEHGGRIRAMTSHQGISHPSGSHSISGSNSSSGSKGAVQNPPAAAGGFSGRAASSSGTGASIGATGASGGASKGFGSGGNAASGVQPGPNAAMASGGSGAGRLTSAPGAVPMGAGGRLAEVADAETRVIAPGEDYFKTMADAAQAKAAAGKSSGAAGAHSGGAVRKKSALVPAAIGLVILAAGAGGWFFLQQKLPQNDSQSGGLELEGEGTAKVSETPAVETPAVEADRQPEVPDGRTAPDKTGPDKPEAQPQDTPVFLPIQPTIPAAGFTASEIHVLRNEELAWILTEQKDTKLLRLVIAEIAGRNSSELILRLMPVSMHQDYAVRIDVIKTLSRSDFRANPEVMAIITAALSDSEFLVRGFAAKTLAAVGSPEAVKALAQREGEEKNQVVLKVIQDALAASRKDPAAPK